MNEQTVFALKPIGRIEYKEGKPKDLVKINESFTGRFLKKYFRKHRPVHIVT